MDALAEKQGQKYGKDESALMIRWASEQGVVPITTSSKEARLKKYLDHVVGWI